MIIKHDKLVYGIIGESLVFVPQHDAELLADKWFAIRNSKTWQDFIDFTSKEVFDELIYEILDYLELTDLFPNYMNGEDLSTYITDLVLPQPDDEFSTDILPGFDTGDYMPMLQQEMIAWLPEDLLHTIGEIREDEEHGFLYHIPKENEKPICALVEASGYEISSNPELVSKAAGLI